MGHCRGIQPNVLTQASAERWPDFSANSWPVLRNAKHTGALCILSPGQPNLRQFSQGCEHQEFNSRNSLRTLASVICLDAPSILVQRGWDPNASGKSNTPICLSEDFLSEGCLVGRHALSACPGTPQTAAVPTSVAHINTSAFSMPGIRETAETMGPPRELTGATDPVQTLRKKAPH